MIRKLRNRFTRWQVQRNEENLADRLRRHYQSSRDVNTTITGLKTDTGTWGTDYGAGLKTHKLEAALGLIDLLAKSDLSPNLPVVYVASGLDVEFPLLLGMEEIIMVDPILSSERKKTELIERLRKNYNVTGENNGEIRLGFDYGAIKPIRIVLRGQTTEEYVPDGGIGVLLEYAGPPPRRFFTKHHLMASLAAGGLMYDGAEYLDDEVNPKNFGFGEALVLSARSILGNSTSEAIYIKHDVTSEHVQLMQELTHRDREETQIVLNTLRNLGKPGVK